MVPAFSQGDPQAITGKAMWKDDIELILRAKKRRENARTGTVKALAGETDT